MYSLEESFRILRVTLEGRFAAPAVFTVTSAHRGDGTTYVAAGIARAFAEAGERTLLIGASEQSVTAELGIAPTARGTITPLGLVTVSAELPNLSVLTLAASSREHPILRDVDATLAEMREKFRAVIIDAAPVPTSSSAYQFARDADGVLLAVRVGRTPLAADRELMRLLTEAGAETIGVVPTRTRRNARPTWSTSTAVVPAEPDYEHASRLATRKVEVVG